MTAAVLAEPASSTAPHGERSAGCLCHHLQDGRTHSKTRRVIVTSAAVHPPPGNPLTAENKGVLPRPLPANTPDEDVCSGVTEGPPPPMMGRACVIAYSANGSTRRLLRDVCSRYGSAAVWGKHHSQRKQSSDEELSHAAKDMQDAQPLVGGKLYTPAHTSVVINTHTGVRKRSDNNSQVSMAALCGADKTML